jgi:hypothetical protein
MLNQLAGNRFYMCAFHESLFTRPGGYGGASEKGLEKPGCMLAPHGQLQALCCACSAHDQDPAIVQHAKAHLRLHCAVPTTQLQCLAVQFLWEGLCELATAQSYICAAAQLQASTGGVAMINVPDILLPITMEEQFETFVTTREKCTCFYLEPGTETPITGSPAHPMPIAKKCETVAVGTGEISTGLHHGVSTALHHGPDTARKENSMGLEPVAPSFLKQGCFSQR